MGDLLFNRMRHYVGSGGEHVELRPAREVQAMAGRKWLYRFPHDKRWRISADKFLALLHAAWEVGKSGAAMAWTPTKKPRPVNPSLKGRSIYNAPWVGQHDGQESGATDEQG